VLDDVLGSADDPSALLKAAYDGIAPGGLLVATLGHRRDHHRPDPEVASPETPRERTSLPRQHLQTLLFREGFVSPRWRELPGPGLLVTARRGDLAPPYSRPQRLSVIVPVYDEAATFPKMMADLLAKEIPGVEIDVIVVESNSTDGTQELALGYADHPRVELILEERARGKGHAVRTGLTHAQGDFILIQDADLEYDMDDYEALLAPLRSFETGFVLGVRAPTQGAIWGIRRFSSAPRLSRLMNAGSFIFRTMFNLVYRQRLRDPFTMAKVFRRDCVHGMKLQCNRFDFDWELLAKLLRAGCTPVEVPIYYRSRSFEEGKKIRIFRDSITWIVACFRYRFARFEI
jgi:glycosyltransferase involved in cell wall biosynthesis